MGAAVGREASVIAVMALTSDLRSIRARGRSSGRKARAFHGHKITSTAEDDTVATRLALCV